jgi:DNA-binding LacI/PurR family transcriptional regulator
MAILYKRVYEELRAAIRAGEYPVDTRLPSEAELTEKFSVSPITLKRALDLLRIDGYIVRRPRLGTVVVSTNPSPAPEARDTRRPLIGCVITNFDDTFGTRVVEGLLDEAATDAHVIVKRSLGDLQLEDEVIRSLVDAGISGLVLLPSTSEYIPPAALELVMKKFPVIILDRSFDGIPVSAVSSDNFAGAKNATEYLFELGHTRVGLVMSSSHVSTNADRRNGYVHAHASHHMPLDPSREFASVGSTAPGSTETIDSDIENLMRFVESDPTTTAFFATEYNIALLLSEACRRLGKSIPGDVSIVCFDHPDASFDRGLFRYTHVAQDQSRMGARAAEQVLAQIADRDGIDKSSLETRLVLGQSTRRLTTEHAPAATPAAR